MNELLEQFKHFDKMMKKMKQLKIPKNGQLNQRNISQVSNIIPPHIMKQMGGMGAVQNMMKSLGGMGDLGSLAKKMMGQERPSHPPRVYHVKPPHNEQSQQRLYPFTRIWAPNFTPKCDPILTACPLRLRLLLRSSASRPPAAPAMALTREMLPKLYVALQFLDGPRKELKAAKTEVLYSPIAHISRPPPHLTDPDSHGVRFARPPHRGAR